MISSPISHPDVGPVYIPPDVHKLALLLVFMGEKNPCRRRLRKYIMTPFRDVRSAVHEIDVVGYAVLT